MSKVEQMIDEIMDFIFAKHGENAELGLGVWSEESSPHTYYAWFTSRDGKVLLGETYFDTDTMRRR